MENGCQIIEHRGGITSVNRGASGFPSGYLRSSVGVFLLPFLVSGRRGLQKVFVRIIPGSSQL